MEKSKVKKQVLFLIILQHGPFTARKLSILPRSLAVVKVSNNKTENAVHSFDALQGAMVIVGTKT